MNKKIEISALAFNKNFFEFKKDVNKCLEYGINNLHYDIMDNIFVPNSSFQNLEKLDSLIKKGFSISAHLMVSDVEKYVKKLVYKSVKYITFHCESQNIEKSIEIIRYIRGKNIKCGIAIKPKTNIEEYKKLIEMSDILTVMSVEPGFGGQKFLENSPSRISDIKKLCKNNTLIQIDGGINDETIRLVKNYCDFFVTGSYLYKNMENYKNILEEINS